MTRRQFGEEHAYNGQETAPHGGGSAPMRATFGDGFGGRTAAAFPSPIETLPILPTGLPKVPDQKPPRVYGSKGIGDQSDQGGEIHGYACKEKGCGFTAKSGHGFARHVHAKHGYGGLGRVRGS